MFFTHKGIALKIVRKEISKHIKKKAVKLCWSMLFLGVK